MKHFNHTWMVLSLCLAMLGCKSQDQQSSKGKSYSKKELQDYNKVMARKEAEQVKSFVAEKKWPCAETGTGLHFWIYQKGKGAMALPGQYVEVNLVISFLSGDTAYSYTRYGSEMFQIDRTNKESGLNEGVQLMSKGAKAKLVVPSHLAHGLVGDAKRIPPRTPLVFDVEVINIYDQRPY